MCLLNLNSLAYKSCASVFDFGTRSAVSVLEAWFSVGIQISSRSETCKMEFGFVPTFIKYVPLEASCNEQRAILVCALLGVGVHHLLSMLSIECCAVPRELTKVRLDNR